MPKPRLPIPSYGSLEDFFNYRRSLGFVDDIRGHHYVDASDFISGGAGTSADPWNTADVVDAINSVPSAGGIVVLAPGYWEGRFDVSKANIILEGMGAGTIVRPASGQTDYVVGIEATDVLFRNFVITGSGTAGIGVRGSANGTRRFIMSNCDVGNTVDYGVNLRGTSSGTEDQDCHFINCYIHDITAAQQYEGGIVTGGTQYHRRIHVNGCRFKNIDSGAGNETGLCVGIDINEGSVVNSFAENFRVFYLTGMSDTIISNNTLVAPSNNGFVLDFDVNANNNIFSNNVIYKASGTGAHLIFCSGTANQINNNKILCPALQFNSFIQVQGQDHIISGNSMDGLGDTAGINVVGSRCLIANNRIRIRQADAGFFPPGIKITGAYNNIGGNYIYDSEIGVLLTGAEMCKIDGNYLHTIRRHGINLNGGTRCSVNGNHIYGVSQETNNTYHDIFLEGTSTRNIIAENIIFENLTNKANTGLKEGAVADDFNRWSNNRVNGPATAAIALLGASSVNDANDTN